MACSNQQISGCAFGQFLVQQTPVFDELIMEDITPVDGWLGNVSTHNVENGTPTEITQDRFRTVVPNTARPWRKASTGNCISTPCDPPSNQIGWGSDRLTYFEEEQTWETPLLCFEQLITVTAAQEQMANIITKTLKPATSYVSSAFLRKRTLFWSKYKLVSNKNLDTFTYQWNTDASGNEVFFDANQPPTNIFKLVPQALQNFWSPLMLIGYGGMNPFKDTAPFIELVTDMETCWELDKLGGQMGDGGANNPNVAANWRFTEWDAANKYWRYGFSGQVGNFLVRVDPMNLRFNYVTDLGAAANSGSGNRYRYQLVLPYLNEITTGAGGNAGIGRDFNPAFQKAHFSLTFISHKMGLSLGTRMARSINPEMPYLHQDFGGRWQFLMHDLGGDVDGVPINNQWGNKGKFGAWFRYYIQPLHTEFLVSYFHKREQFCIPEINTCSADPGYPTQSYNSALPNCPVPAAYAGLYAGGTPSGSQDGPIPAETPS